MAIDYGYGGAANAFAQGLMGSYGTMRDLAMQKQQLAQNEAYRQALVQAQQRAGELDGMKLAWQMSEAEKDRKAQLQQQQMMMEALGLLGFAPSQPGGGGQTASGFLGRQRVPVNMNDPLSVVASQLGISQSYLPRLRAGESGGNNNAVSPRGATGPFQFTRNTARSYDLMGPNFDYRTDLAKSALAAGQLALDNSAVLAGSRTASRGSQGQPLAALSHQIGPQNVISLMQLAKSGNTDPATYPPELLAAMKNNLGIMPAGEYLQAANQFYGMSGPLRQPTATGGQQPTVPGMTQQGVANAGGPDAQKKAMLMLIMSGISPQNAMAMVQGLGPKTETTDSGYEIIRDPATGGVTMRPIPGGPAEKKIVADETAAGVKQATKELYGNVVLDSLDRAINIVETAAFPVTGMFSVFNNIPGTPGRSLNAAIDTVRANASLDKLQLMRESSNSGASGLGQVTEKEHAMLQDSITKLDAATTEADFLRALNDVKRIYTQIIYPNGVPDGFETMSGSGAGTDMDREAEALINEALGGK